jgi:hypothetical protein
MRLTTHFGRLQRDNIQDRAIGAEQAVETAAEIFFLEFIG